MVVLVVLVLLAGVAWWQLPPRALGFAHGRTVSLAAYGGPSPTGVPADLRSADLVTRGRYLTAAADCEICHTRPGGQPFAGGLAFETPFGVMYSPNITADADTGIGSYSDADFLHAIHDGVGKGGKRLYPAFPYESYTLLTDEDALAIKAYLFSLPKVRSAPPSNELLFPFNQRWLMAFWSFFYNPGERFEPREDRSPDWNRGAYLAEALAHCGDCHTPRNLGQALNNRHKFAGAVAGGWRAFNITPDSETGIGQWSDDDLFAYLHTGHASGHGAADGAMGDVFDVSLRGLTVADVRALVAYVRSVPSVRARGFAAVNKAPASEVPESLVAESDARGRRVFEGACASCHGWSGESLLSNYATLVGDRAVNDASAINVAHVVLAGDRGREPQGLSMPAFGAAYSDTEIAAVANYVVGRFGAQTARLTPNDVASLREHASE